MKNTKTMNIRLFRIEHLNAQLPQIGKIFDTTETFDTKRLHRYSDLKILFEKINHCSITYNLAISIILELMITTNADKFEDLIRQLSLNKDEIIEMKQLYNEKRFKISTDSSNEGRYLFDFYLELAREKIFNELRLDLPDRFKSKYFFESIDDCLNYMKTTHRVGKIIEVEPIEVYNYLKADNNFLSSFDDNANSYDLIQHAESFLLKDESINPLFEIVLCGKYRVVSHIGWKQLLRHNFFR